MEKTMKAVITIAPKTSIVKDIPEPSMDDNSVKIKVKY